MSATPTTSNRSFERATAAAAVCLALAMTLVGLAGCGGEAQAELDDYLDELELDTPLESVEEIEVGSYYISAAAVVHGASGREAPSVWVRIRFKLYAAVAPEDKSAVTAALERHRGMLDDAVITICRKTSINDLQDSRWATIKSEIVDHIRPLLGEHRVRQMIFDEFTWEPL